MLQSLLQFMYYLMSAYTSYQIQKQAMFTKYKAYEKSYIKGIYDQHH